MNLESARDRLADLLKKTNLRIAFAESCTGGLCSATMAQVDGISKHLYGSVVTYQPLAKQQWLDVKEETINKYTCESIQVACEMLGTLTENVHWAASVVGHIADDQLSVIHIAIKNWRGDYFKFPGIAVGGKTRVERQRNATALVLIALTNEIVNANGV